jgi:hypothetical protein
VDSRLLTLQVTVTSLSAETAAPGDLIATLAIRELAQGLVHRLQHIVEPPVVDALAGPLCLAYVAIGMAGWPTGSSLRV